MRGLTTHGFISCECMVIIYNGHMIYTCHVAWTVFALFNHNECQQHLLRYIVMRYYALI